MAKIEDEKNYSSYWNWKGRFDRGPQPCGCGGPSDCPKREEHIKKAIKQLEEDTNKKQAVYAQFLKDHPWFALEAFSINVILYYS